MAGGLGARSIKCTWGWRGCGRRSQESQDLAPASSARLPPGSVRSSGASWLPLSWILKTRVSVQDGSCPPLSVTLDLSVRPLPALKCSHTQELISHLVQTHDTA